MSKELTSFDDLKARIYTIRGIKVMLDQDLSHFYGVKTHHLNERVKRNIKRFPPEFMFQLTSKEVEDIANPIMGSQNLISQIAISSWGGRRTFPYAFTEQGVAMLSSILRSDIAIEINIKIMKAFVELRQTIKTQPEYALLKETIHRIESRMDSIEANHLVDNMVSTQKMTQLSKDALQIRQDVQHISDLFDQFHDAHVIIKRPEEGFNQE